MRDQATLKRMGKDHCSLWPTGSLDSQHKTSSLYPMMKRLTVATIIVITGFVSTSTSIICMRQLAALVGNSILITSMIIGLLMLGLAYGFKRSHHCIIVNRHILVRSLLIAAAFTGIGLSYYFIFFFFHIIEKYIFTNSFIALLFYLIVIMTPLMYYLGKVFIITMNFYTSPQGTIAKVLYLGAIGGFLGSIITAPVFMHFAGVQATTLINCVLLILAALSLGYIKVTLINNVVFIISALSIIFSLNYQEIKMSILSSNEYSNYMLAKDYITDDNRFGTVFSINHSASAFSEKGNQKGFSYIEKIKELLFKQLNFRNKNILVLGAGAFSISASDAHNNQFVYVDIDPNLKEIVENHIAKVNGEFIASDARLFLRKNMTKFDVIISDVYSHKRTIPQHLITKEYFSLVAQNTKPNGLAIFNIIMNPFLKDAYSIKIDNTIRSVFDFCTTTTLGYSEFLTNVLYVCDLDKKKKTSNIYTDNNSSVLDALFD
ncbi:MAG TPA: fused MFS/spermidine synthase [Gammaproteobacteria bacterium]|nr:fused MFS/spermidine synthase [Gammaproteobacteria bacterium]